MGYYAHSGEDTGSARSDWQLLAEHLRNVAKLAKHYAELAIPDRTDFHTAAFFMGLLHDLGKYREGFQRRLMDRNIRGEDTWHKQAGAAHADANSRPDIAFVVAGHHGGLPDKAGLKELISGPGGKAILPQLLPIAREDCPEICHKIPCPPSPYSPLDWDLLVRLLFSCLVDADWTDTTKHYRRVRQLPPEPEPVPLDSEAMLVNVMAYISQRSALCSEENIGRIRQEILQAALKTAEMPPGLFSMTVPTGGGKTLSGLAFALKHAKHHRLNRVIYVAPYLSIIEQNAREIRRALGVTNDSELVFEHHSLAEPFGGDDLDEAQSEEVARQAENWSAPVVITSSVQFFESLFSNRPGQCRKLHNLARSVVLLDECQTLPSGLVAPTCSMMADLSRLTNCSLVLCTATQPTWKRRPDLPDGLVDVREIVPTSLNLFSRLRRVQVHWPGIDESALEWNEIACRMAAYQSCLCVVNTKPSAREIYRQLRDLGCQDALHLSTTMCPAHRLEVIDEVRQRLNANLPCRLVSTQLIEAGVDIDFPFVMRELSPLEGIIQAAGRCNREGRLNHPDGSPGGEVLVFRSVEGKLPVDQWYRKGVQTVKEMLAVGDVPDIGRPEDIEIYFQRFYRKGETDERRIQMLRQELGFRTIWEGDRERPLLGKYRLIEQNTVPVVVATWSRRTQQVERLLEELNRTPSRKLYRQLAPLQVNLYQYQLEKLREFVTDDPSGVMVWHGTYHDDLGLCSEASEIDLVF